MDDKIALELLKYIAENLEVESIFLTPCPTASVGVVGLLDKIAELRNVNREFNGQQFNDILDNK